MRRFYIKTSDGDTTYCEIDEEDAEAVLLTAKRLGQLIVIPLSLAQGRTEQRPPTAIPYHAIVWITAG